MEQLYLFRRLAALEKLGWSFQPDANRFRVHYPESIIKKWKLLDSAHLFNSLTSLECAIVAAEAAQDVLDVMNLIATRKDQHD